MKVSADTFFREKCPRTLFSEKSVRGHFYLKMSADTVSGFLDGAYFGARNCSTSFDSSNIECPDLAVFGQSLDVCIVVSLLCDDSVEEYYSLTR